MIKKIVKEPTELLATHEIIELIQENNEVLKLQDGQYEVFAQEMIDYFKVQIAAGPSNDKFCEWCGEVLPDGGVHELGPGCSQECAESIENAMEFTPKIIKIKGYGVEAEKSIETGNCEHCRSVVDLNTRFCSIVCEGEKS